VTSTTEDWAGEGPNNVEWSLSLTCLRDGSNLQLKYENGIMTIATPHMKVAADIIQSLAQEFDLDTVQVNLIKIVLANNENVPF
jgi:hypothetical protein